MHKADAAIDAVDRGTSYTGDTAIRAVYEYLKAGGGKIKIPIVKRKTGTRKKRMRRGC
jgi:hypothetical protein